MREGHLEVDTSHPQGTRDVFLLIGGDCMSFCSTVTNTEQLHRNNALIDYFLLKRYHVDTLGSLPTPYSQETCSRMGPWSTTRAEGAAVSWATAAEPARRTVTGAEPCPTAQVSWRGQVVRHAKHGLVAPISKVVTNPLQPRTPLDTPPASWASSL